MKHLLKGLLLAAALLGGPRADAAAILNQGFNITSQNLLQYLLGQDSAATPVAFYDSTNGAIDNNGGTALKGLTIIPPGLANNSYSITFDAAAVFGPAMTGGHQIGWATLFVDAMDIGSGDNVNVFVNGLLLGALGNNSSPGQIPLLDGGYTTLPGENDNTVFLLPEQLLLDLAADNSFTISFQRLSGNMTLDGINIQATPNPEPGTLILLGGGIAGVLGYARRRQRRA